jgi:hypothetical protein
MRERASRRLLLGGAIVLLLVIAVWVAFATGYVNWPIWQS